MNFSGSLKNFHPRNEKLMIKKVGLEMATHLIKKVR